MASDHDRAERHLKRLLESMPTNPEETAAEPLPAKIATSARVEQSARDRRWEILSHVQARGALEPPERGDDAYWSRYQGRIENLIGEVSLPVGVIGPLRIHGTSAQGDYYVPLATTESALVASYNRGCLALTQAGGCRAAVLAESVSRAPSFKFRTVDEVGRFCQWLFTQDEGLRAAAASTSRFGRMESWRASVDGNLVFLVLDYLTGEAAGQNMVTIASQAVCEFILRESPVKPQIHYVESNFSGDKKATMQSFQGVRGKKVTVEVVLDETIVRRVLRTEVSAMLDYWRTSVLGGVLSGMIGVQGHFANGLAAVFLATGQDVACVAEAAVGVTRMEPSSVSPGALYVSVTLPNLIVGTVGGGTSLPGQRAALDLMGLSGPGSARSFAEIVAATCLAGELSIIAALSAGHFTQAHKKLGRS